MGTRWLVLSMVGLAGPAGADLAEQALGQATVVRIIASPNGPFGLGRTHRPSDPDAEEVGRIDASHPAFAMLRAECRAGLQRRAMACGCAAVWWLVLEAPEARLRAYVRFQPSFGGCTLDGVETYEAGAPPPSRWPPEKYQSVSCCWTLSPELNEALLQAVPAALAAEIRAQQADLARIEAQRNLARAALLALPTLLALVAYRLFRRPASSSATRLKA